MFLHLLDDDQKRAFFFIADEMVTADGKIVNEEVRYLSCLIVESGLSDDLGSIKLAEDLDLTAFADRPAQVAVTVELLVIAIIDGHYHINEAGLARRASDAFGFSDVEHEQIKRIAENIGSGIVGFNELSELGGRATLIHCLTAAQKSAFFALAGKMIAADMIITDLETCYLRRLFVDSGLGGDLEEIVGDGEIDRAVFNDRASRLAVAAELFIIAAIDGGLHRDEAAFANALVYEFGLNEAERRQLVRVAGNISSALIGVEQLIGVNA